MSRTPPLANGETKTAIAALFENSPPVLVEVRFPSAAACPDSARRANKGGPYLSAGRISTLCFQRLPDG